MVKINIRMKYIILSHNVFVARTKAREEIMHCYSISNSIYFLKKKSRTRVSSVTFKQRINY